MIPPAWLTPLPGAAASQAIDAWAIAERGVAALDLMERAAAGLAALVQDVAPFGLVVVCCGGGNNGGDGYAAARLLRAAWREVRVLAVTDPAALKGDARVQFERLTGDPALPFAAKQLDGAAVIVDAMLGTGSGGELRGATLAAVAAIAVHDAPVVAADIPSGVDASSGEVAGPAVTAVATAAFHASKPGLWIAPGKYYAGRVTVVDIGIPDGAPCAATAGLIDDHAVLGALPSRGAADTKFTSGVVLVAGGSQGLLGAVTLSTQAALRAGAGYVVAAVPGSEQRTLASQSVEVMQMVLPGDEGHHVEHAAPAVLEAASGRGAVLVIGPGLGRDRDAAAFARALAAGAAGPVVLDADGLNAFAGDLSGLAARAAPTVLTPHEGELGRLLSSAPGAIAAGRLAAARQAAQEGRAVVVLKGDDTLIARPDGLVAISPGATAGLATAGTGDVLGGVIAALVARGCDPFHAACAGVRLHARAALHAAALFGVDGMIASDVVAAIPAARGSAHVVL